MSEPRERGELGYGDWCIHLTEMGLCSCDGYGGHLVDATCISCGCHHSFQEPTPVHRQRFAMWGPVPEPDRCSHPDAVRAEEARELERQGRSRWTAEGLGDARR